MSPGAPGFFMWKAMAKSSVQRDSCAQADRLSSCFGSVIRRSVFQTTTILKVEKMVKIALYKKWNSVTGEYYIFLRKRRVGGVGSFSVEMIEGTEEFVHESALDEQGSVRA